MSELLPCPSCGGPAKTKKITTGWFLLTHSRNHKECKIPRYVDTDKHREILEERWNNRYYVKQWGAHEDLTPVKHDIVGKSDTNCQSSQQAH